MRYKIPLLILVATFLRSGYSIDMYRIDNFERNNKPSSQ